MIQCDVRRLASPDARTVDFLARLQLTASRLGCTIRLVHPSEELLELLDLFGLTDVLSCYDELVVEPGRQPEEREHARGVEEETYARDLAVGDLEDLQ